MYYKYRDQETPQSFLHIRRAQQGASSVFKYLPNTHKTIPKNTTAVSKKKNCSLSFHPYLITSNPHCYHMFEEIFAVCK